MAKFILSAFGDEIHSELKTQMDILDEAGIKYIEMRGVNRRGLVDHSLDEAKDIKRQLDARGFRLSAVGSPIGKIGITDDFAPHLTLFKHTVEIAKIMETRNIRMFSFFMPEEGKDAKDGNNAKDGKDTKDAKDAKDGKDTKDAKDGSPEKYRGEVIRRLEEFVRIAEDSGLVLMHENEKGIYGDTAERCLDLLETMNSSSFRLTFDPANFVQCGVRTYPHAYGLLKEHIAYLHIKDALEKDHSVVPSGYGDGKMKEILTALYMKGFEGFLSIEHHLGRVAGVADDILERSPRLKAMPDGGPKFFLVAYEALAKIKREIEAAY